MPSAQALPAPESLPVHNRLKQRWAADENNLETRAEGDEARLAAAPLEAFKYEFGKVGRSGRVRGVGLSLETLRIVPRF